MGHRPKERSDHHSSLSLPLCPAAGRRLVAPNSNPKQVSSRVRTELLSGPAGARQHLLQGSMIASRAVWPLALFAQATPYCQQHVSLTQANNKNAVGAQDVAASSSSAAHAAQSEAADPGADDRASIDSENRRLLSQMQSHEVRCSPP